MGRPWEGCQHLITIKTLRSGGRRPGAGRPPGSKSRPTREFLASLHKTECRVDGGVAVPIPGHRRQSPAPGSHRT
jgi:hypothetical protein